MELTTLTTEELDTLRVDVLNEQERRANLAAIPAQVATLAKQFVAAGGLQSMLDEAIVPPPEPVHQSEPELATEPEVE